MYVTALHTALPLLQSISSPRRTANLSARASVPGGDAFVRSTPAQQQPKFGMLVLSRKLGEKIYIGEDICVTVVDIDRGKIRLGIDAPNTIPIYRQELLPTTHKAYKR